MSLLDVEQDLTSVEAELSYLAPSREGPRTYTYDPPPNTPQTTAVNISFKVPIRDARPLEGEFKLDEHGFELVEHHSAVHDFYDDEEVKAVYYPEAELLLKEVTGASRVFVFDHIARRRVPGAEDRRGGLRQPVHRVHVDHTAKSGPKRVRDLLGDDAEELLHGRVQIINVWRPIKGPLLDAPLALCHAGTLADGDLVAQDLIYRDRTGEIYALFYNEAHRWLYAPVMIRDEVLLLKCFDSVRDGRARFMPHTSFEDPTAPAEKPLRESIELRTLLFFPD